ncbi:MAG: hypothetical protein Q9191_005725 [Dirinaria sp. TL-2023a]
MFEVLDGTFMCHVIVLGMNQDVTAIGAGLASVAGLCNDIYWLCLNCAILKQREKSWKALFIQDLKPIPQSSPHDVESGARPPLDDRNSQKSPLRDLPTHPRESEECSMLAKTHFGFRTRLKPIWSVPNSIRVVAYNFVAARGRGDLIVRLQCTQALFIFSCSIYNKTLGPFCHSILLASILPERYAGAFDNQRNASQLDWMLPAERNLEERAGPVMKTSTYAMYVLMLSTSFTCTVASFGWIYRYYSHGARTLASIASLVLIAYGELQ